MLEEATEAPKKRARSSNFTPEEKVLLLNLVGSHKNVLESKKTDTVMRRQKEEVWRQIEHQFNAANPSLIRRNWSALKTFYENKKKEVRKLAATETREIKKTGGGIAPKLIDDPTYELTLALLNKKTVYGLQNKFDGDSNNITENMSEAVDNISTENSETIIINTIDEDDEEQNEIGETLITNNDQGETRFTPQTTPVRPRLQRGRRFTTTSSPCHNNWTSRRRPCMTASGNLSKKYEDLADLKIELAELQKTLLQAECENQKRKHQWEERQRENIQQREEEEAILRKQLLQLETQIKRAQLQVLLGN